MRYADQQRVKEKARRERNKQRRKVEKWMSAYREKYGLEPSLRETGKHFGRSGTWVMILLRMKDQDER